jgi:hypothetical protein
MVETRPSRDDLLTAVSRSSHALGTARGPRPSGVEGERRESERTST